jgi:hypothetical protein
MAHAEEIAPRRPTPEESCRSTGRDRGHARPLSDSVLTPDRILNVAWANSFFALAREVQKQLEDVDEVQVERECPEHGELLLRLSLEILGVLLLNRLGIPCGRSLRLGKCA